jgi:hypothetical protein
MFSSDGGFRQGSWRDDRPVGEVTHNKPDGTVEVEVFQEPREVLVQSELPTWEPLGAPVTATAREDEHEDDEERELVVRREAASVGGKAAPEEEDVAP